MTSRKSITRRETSIESDINLGHQLIRETQAQGKLAAADFVDQLLGFESSVASNDASSQQATESTTAIPRQERTKSKNTPENQTGIIFEIFSQIKGGESSSTGKATEKFKIRQNSELAPRLNREPAIHYHSEYRRSITMSRENLSQRESYEMKRQIKQIMNELKKLANSTKALSREFGHVTVDAAPSTPGKYYVNFFDWLLIMIQQARQRVEDSNTWLETMKGKNQKLNYWGMAKKLGTQFTQANERNVATSTG